MVSTAPPALNGSVLARDHAIPVIGLSESVEVDTRVTVSPASGTAGNHLNEAAGAPAPEPDVDVDVDVGVDVDVDVDPELVVGVVIVNVAGLLTAPAWVATAVYCRADRADFVWPDVQPAPVPVAVAVVTTAPFPAFAPA